MKNKLLSLSPSPVASEYEKMSSVSGSIVLIVATAVPTAAFSTTVDVESETSIGLSFKSFTLSVSFFSKIRSPESFVCKRMEYEDLDSKSGV